MERFSLGDAAELAGDVGPDPRLIGVLAELDRPIALAALRELIAERLPAQPILAHRVVRNGPATWNASWQRVDVRVEDHVFEVRTSDPLATATRLVGEDLGHEVPAWRLILLSGPDESALWSDRCWAPTSRCPTCPGRGAARWDSSACWPE